MGIKEVLINFSVSNMLSFKDRVQFSMIASELSRFDDRIRNFDNFQFRLLPISAVYGGNATGKSNFVLALKFIKEFVTEGTMKPDTPISITPFLLNPETRELDTKFEIDVLVDDLIYEYSFSVNRVKVTEEKLVTTDQTSEKLQFKRVGEKFKLDGIFRKSKKKDLEFYKFLCKSTRKNQLFLTSMMMHEVELFKPLNDWFEKLMIISPYSDSNLNFLPCFFKKHPYELVLNEAVRKLDFGISTIGADKISYDHDISDQIKSEIVNDMKADSIAIWQEDFGNKIKLSMEDGRMIAEELIANHIASDGKSIKFHFRQESDGTKRVMDLLPVFINLANQDSVLIIDEIEKSMHPILVRRLIESYFDNCATQKIKSQLLFTTHNVDLLDKKLLRPDEIWVTDKGLDEDSKIESLIDYKESIGDVDFQKCYLEGRFGGVPQIQLGGLLDKPKGMRKSRGGRKNVQKKG